MSFLAVNNWRNSRNYNQNNMFSGTHVPSANYCTGPVQNSQMKTKCSDDVLTNPNNTDMDKTDLFINNFHLITDPLRKNLADTLISTKARTEMPEPKTEIQREYPTLSGITSFISTVFNTLSSAMFRRPKSPVYYYDCCDFNDSPEEALPPWQPASDDQNKNEQDVQTNFNNYNPILTRESLSDSCDDSNVSIYDMAECKMAVASCEKKLNKVKQLLCSKTTSSPSKLKRRPKKVFVEAGSVEENFEDAFSYEDFESIPNEKVLHHTSPMRCCNDNFCKISSALHLLDMCQTLENTDIITELPNVVDDISQEKVDLCETSKNENLICTKNVITACEIKLSELKVMLQKKSKNDKCDSGVVPVENNKVDCLPQLDDMNFAHEIGGNRTLPITSAVSEEAKLTTENIEHEDYFDEMTGRFRSESTSDSEDSFQIVVSDGPRRRKPSECDSEDSFIVFEESPDSCYTANDVFEDSDYSDTDDDSEVSDSGYVVNNKMSPSLTKSVNNLIDDDLFEDQDVVDCAFRTSDFNENSGGGVYLDSLGEVNGLQLNKAKKELKKNSPPKKVHFSPLPPKVHVMRVWTFAAKQARAGHWERYALDRDRFKRRIADVDVAVSWVLKPQHRSQVMFQRFMPWWNAEKRKQLAEKQQKEKEALEKANNEVNHPTQNAEEKSRDSGEESEMQDVSTEIKQNEEKKVTEGDEDKNLDVKSLETLCKINKRKRYSK